MINSLFASVLGSLQWLGVNLYVFCNNATVHLGRMAASVFSAIDQLISIRNKEADILQNLMKLFLCLSPIKHVFVSSDL